jgi:hypothetical protein
MSSKKVADPVTFMKEFNKEINEEAKKGKKKNIREVVSLPDPFGLASHRKIAVTDA